MEEATTQLILSSIANIKVPGIATMAYWSILETGDGIYFVQTGSALGLGIGAGGILMAASVVGDIVSSRESKQAGKNDLSTVLEKSSQYFNFNKETITQIQTKKGLLGGGSVVFPNGKQKSWAEAGYVKLKLSGKKFKLFSEMLKRK